MNGKRSPRQLALPLGDELRGYAESVPRTRAGRGTAVERRVVALLSLARSATPAVGRLILRALECGR